MCVRDFPTRSIALLLMHLPLLILILGSAVRGDPSGCTTLYKSMGEVHG